MKGKFRPDCLHPVYAELFDVVGRDAALKIYQYYRGSVIQFPVHLYAGEALIKAVRASNGSSRDLARQFGYSERWVREHRGR